MVLNMLRFAWLGKAIIIPPRTITLIHKSTLVGVHPRELRRDVAIRSQPLSSKHELSCEPLEASLGEVFRGLEHDEKHSNKDVHVMSTKFSRALQSALVNRQLVNEVVALFAYDGCVHSPTSRPAMPAATVGREKIDTLSSPAQLHQPCDFNGQGAMMRFFSDFVEDIRAIGSNVHFGSPIVTAPMQAEMLMNIGFSANGAVDKSHYILMCLKLWLEESGSTTQLAIKSLSLRHVDSPVNTHSVTGGYMDEGILANTDKFQQLQELVQGVANDVESELFLTRKNPSWSTDDGRIRQHIWQHAGCFDAGSTFLLEKLQLTTGRLICIGKLHILDSVLTYEVLTVDWVFFVDMHSRCQCMENLW